MFAHNKRLQYTVRVGQTNPGLANLLLEQFGGPQGELAAACRYFTQALAEDDPGRKDMLLDIATEELSHLEVIGTLVAMLNKGAKGRLAEATEEAGELYRSITGAGNDSHLTQVLYGGGPALTNSAGYLWTAAYIDTIGEPTADLRSNIAAEARAKIIYERLINATDDPGVKEALGFLMTREIAHQLSFEKALYAITPNYPPGKLPGMPEFERTYFDMSQGYNGDGAPRGAWNSEENFTVVTDRERQCAVDGGDGSAQVELSDAESLAVDAAARRTMSDPEINPTTGAELGQAPGADLASAAAAELGRKRSGAQQRVAGADLGQIPAGEAESSMTNLDETRPAAPGTAPATALGAAAVVPGQAIPATLGERPTTELDETGGAEEETSGRPRRAS